MLVGKNKNHKANKRLKAIGKTFVLAGFLLAGRIYCYGQVDSLSNKSVIRLDLSAFVDNIFMYPDFMPGKIVLKNGHAVYAKLNYDRVLGKLLFLGRGKTLAFADPEALDYIAIGVDTFNYFDQGYLRLVTHFPKYNLFTKQTLTYYVKSETGLLGTSVVVITSDPNTAYKSESLSKPDNELSNNSTFVFANEFFVRDQFGQFFPATRRNIMDFNPGKTQELRLYFQNNTVKFGNMADMEKLIEFLNSF